MIAAEKAQEDSKTSVSNPVSDGDIKAKQEEVNELKNPKELTEEEKAAQFSETVDAYADRAIASDNKKSLERLTER